MPLEQIHVTIQYNTIQYNTIQYNTIQYNTIQYNTIQYNTITFNGPKLEIHVADIHINAKNISNMFFTSFIKSVLVFSFVCWYFNLNVKNRNSLERIVRISLKIIGSTQRDITIFGKKQVLRKTCSILVDESHILSPMFHTMPSGHRFRCPACKTNRKKSSFIPVAISLFNDAKLICFMYTMFYILYIYIYFYLYQQLYTLPI